MELKYAMKNKENCNQSKPGQIKYFKFSLNRFQSVPQIPPKKPFKKITETSQFMNVKK